MLILKIHIVPKMAVVFSIILFGSTQKRFSASSATFTIVQNISWPIICKIIGDSAKTESREQHITRERISAVWTNVLSLQSHYLLLVNELANSRKIMKSNSSISLSSSGQMVFQGPRRDCCESHARCRTDYYSSWSLSAAIRAEMVFNFASFPLFQATNSQLVQIKRHKSASGMVAPLFILSLGVLATPFPAAEWRERFF